MPHGFADETCLIFRFYKWWLLAVSPSGQNKDGEPGPSQSSSGEPSTAGSAATSTQNLPSFWIPSLTPEAKATLLKKPVGGLPGFLYLSTSVCVVWEDCAEGGCSVILKEQEKVLSPHYLTDSLNQLFEMFADITTDDSGSSNQLI